MWIFILLLRAAKVVTYGILAFFVYTDFIGPEGIAEIIGVSENINDYDTKKGALILSENLIRWTIFAAALEILDNFVGMFPKKTNY
ncbi:hypothetical protein QMA04_06815 [Planococcus sp. APC 3900]|uniref:hypothetical protein n=1 Tax=Planococcus sp. APC 3900 TaxID=3035191 RepID=UPI0025B2EAD5|nr:hypothetical protein [Planococcus sp. APC 3900]MDN3437799.1 hypothetical protein [Planococcus sp. APC 3900]